LDYRILGPLEVCEGDDPIDVGPRQQRALLAILLVHANRVVTTERILEELWPLDPLGKERTLWVYISRLRSILDPGREGHGKSTVLVTRDHGYALVLC
jgi:DNA-binding SARP family transcriptional activator